MTLENIPLFKAMNAKMDYLNQRQRVIAQNVANADTAGYKPRDLTKVDFGSVLKDVNKSNHASVTLRTTNTAHLPMGGDVKSSPERKSREIYEVAPSGNAVNMEEQLMNSDQTVMDYNMMTNLYQKQIGMIKIAIGTQR